MIIKPSLFPGIASLFFSLFAAAPWLAAESVILTNPDFESDISPNPSLFTYGELRDFPSGMPSGWTVVATDSTAVVSGAQLAVGKQNLVPADGNQALMMMAGAVVSQVTGLSWSDLGEGDLLTLTIAAGDRSGVSTATPRWADDSFIGFSDGLAVKADAPGTSGWLANVVSQRSAVSVPPNGFKSGTMGDVIHTYRVGADDHLRQGGVGIFIASLGNRDDSTTGTASGGNQSFWDRVRLSATQAPGATIRTFTSSSRFVESGDPVTLTWDVSGATRVSILPGLGEVAAAGSIEITPVATTTYELVAESAAGSKSRKITVGVPGPAVYRYFRFTPLAMRAGGTEVQLSEFQLLLGSEPVSGASASNPGGSNSISDFEGAPKAVDQLLSTKWYDRNGKPLIINFGRNVVVTGYRFATGNDADGRDPVSWRLEGSIDGSNWFLVDERENETIPVARRAWSDGFPTYGTGEGASAEGSPVVNQFSVTPTTIKEGESITVAWNVADAASIHITGIGVVNPAGSITLRPAQSTNFSLVANNAAGFTLAFAGVVVEELPRGRMTASYDDAEYLTYLDDGSLVSDFPGGEFFAVLDVGRLPFDDVLRHIVIPFQLPDLGPGGFSTAELKLRVYGGSLGANGRTPIQLFGLPDVRPDSYTLASDVVDGADNHLTRGVLLQSGFLNESTPLDAQVGSGTSGSAAAALGYWLNQAYANGANAGQYVFIRLSPDALDIPEGYGFGISTGDDSEENIPSIQYTFDPDGRAGAPVIASFRATSGFVETGTSATLSWSVLGADSVTISPDPGGGPLPPVGSLVVTPSETTTYTLTTQNAQGTQSESFTLTLVDPGSYRYLRFVPVQPRNYGVEFALGEIEFFDMTGPLAVAESSVGAVDWSYGSVFNLTDGDPDSVWIEYSNDLSFAPIVFDYGSQVVPIGYRLATSGENTGTDPVAWRIEGSRDGVEWDVLQTQSAQESALPATRRTYTESFYLVPGVPEIAFNASAAAIKAGGSVTLDWTVSDTDSITIEPGIGVQGPIGSLTLTPADTTTYTLSASGGGITRTKSVNVFVAQGSLAATTYDTLSGLSAIDPVSTLINASASATFEQIGPIGIDGSTNLPGLTSRDTFSVLWQGWFDIGIDGPGIYTFGTAADDGSAIYLDLNGDGDFADIGEKIVGGGNPSSGQTRTVQLDGDSVRIAIAYYEGTGNESFQAKFKKGSGHSFAALDPIGGSVHFQTADPYIALPSVSLAASQSVVLPGTSVTLSWQSANADAVTLSPDPGSGALPVYGSLVLEPAATTTYTISATNASGTRSRSISVIVAASGMVASTYDTTFGSSFLDPISNLMNVLPSGTFVDSSNITYNSSGFAAMPGLTSTDQFAVLWQGWFDVSKQGEGDYTFGTRSDDGSVIWIDLNGDGVFSKSDGELVVNNNGDHSARELTGVANLQGDAVRIAIAFYDSGGGEEMVARFRKGSGYPFGQLDPLGGTSGTVLPAQPAAPAEAPVIAISGAPTALSSVYSEGASVSSSFNLSGSLLSEGITVSAPQGFEVSMQPDSGFAASIVVGEAGELTERSIHVRLKPGLDAGSYSGNLVLTSAGALQKSVAVSGSVARKPLTSNAIVLTRNPDNSFTATASGVGLFSYSYSGRAGTNYGPSFLAPTEPGSYTVTATIADPNFTGSTSEDFTIGGTPALAPFRVTRLSLDGDICSMTWESHTAAVYTIEASTDPADPDSWTPVAEGIVASGGPTTGFSVNLSQSGHADARQLFMRVKASSAP